MKNQIVANILIIDDDDSVRYTLSSLFTPMGHTVTGCENLEQGFSELSRNEFDVTFLDVQLPDGSGLDFLKQIHQLPSPPLVIVMTGYANPEGAESAILNGAWDYLEKPLSLKKISLQMIRALQYRQTRQQVEDPVLLDRQDIIGNSNAIDASLTVAAEEANCDASVLIQGETGTGKELFAKAIHDNSRRARENFMVVDCGIMTESLVESMLFGHVKGAFTGADKAHTGIIAMAHNGTLFLDEIGDLPLSTQASFLRVLQEKKFRPVGGKKEIESDFRLIAATNKDLDQMVKEEKFRQDLLFRLRAINLELPPLRHRKGDIKPLVQHYIQKLCDKYGIAVKGFSPDFIEGLETYEWPGNARELVNTMDSTIAMAHNEPILFPLHLPKPIRICLAKESLEKPAAKPPQPAAMQPEHHLDAPLPKLKEVIETTEKQYFQSLLQSTSGDIKSMCDISGLSRAMVYARLKKYHLSRA